MIVRRNKVYKEEGDNLSKVHQTNSFKLHKFILYKNEL